MSTSDIETRLFYGGQFHASLSGKTFPIYDPSKPTEITAHVHEAFKEDVDAAVAAAKEAQPAWAATSPLEKQRLMNLLADRIMEPSTLKRLNELEARTMGAPTWAGNVAASIFVDTTRYCASLISSLGGYTTSGIPGATGMTFRQPYGVVAGILPWNASLIMLSWKLCPAIAAGNCIVIKSSEKAPLACIEVARIAQSILPSGVFNMVTGFGPTCGQPLAEHMDIRKIAFTGSVNSGKLVQQAASRSNMKVCTLELGGKGCSLIFDDVDVDDAVQKLAVNISYNSGQVCMMNSRLYVQRGVSEKFIPALQAALDAFKIGDPLAEGVFQGPQADEVQFNNIKNILSDDAAAGGMILTGGVDSSDGANGWYVRPTLVRTDHKNPANVREIFGPVATVHVFDTEEEAIALGNDTEYGLHSSVFTKDIHRAFRVAKAIQCGVVGVNRASPATHHELPFGGWKQSGNGAVETGRNMVEMWTHEKAIYLDGC